MTLHEKKRAVAIAPRDVEARVAYGEALLIEGKTSDAASQLEHALSIDPAHRQARRTLFRVYAADKRWTRAESLLVEAVALSPEDVDVRLDLVEILTSQNRPDDALMHFLAAAARGPLDRAAHKRLVSLLSSRGYSARARDALDAYIAEFGHDDFSASALLGPLEVVSALARGPEFLWGRAREVATHMTPESEDDRTLVAAVREDIAIAKRALVTRPSKSPIAEWIRAELKTCGGDHAGASLAWRRLEHVDGLRVLAATRLGEIAFYQGRFRDAVEAYSSATDDVDALEGLGDAHTQLGELAEAEAAFTQASKRAPGGSAAHKLVALRSRTRSSEPGVGVALGLAWTPFGGGTLPIQATLVPGRGELILTGRVRTTGVEQAKVVWSCLKANRDALRMSALDALDLHLHFEDSEIEKDGPSAGLALALASISAAHRAPLSSDFAATGELTLSGTVRPVGGIHEKVIAAYLAKVRRVLLPLKNLTDVQRIPREVAEAVEIVPVQTLSEALSLVTSNELPRGFPRP